MRTISEQTFKRQQEIRERIENLSGRQARIALLKLITDVHMIPRMDSALKIGESYPKEP